MWHMPDDATKGVAEHSSRLQPSINLHAPVKAFMFRVIPCQINTVKNITISKMVHIWYGDWTR